LSFNGNLQPSSDVGEDLTTKGDIHGYSTENTRVPIGTDNYVLTADSSASLGLAWKEAAGGAVSGDEVVMPYSTTIGDYSTPASATASSAATVTATPDYETDFSVNTGWTQGGGGDITVNTGTSKADWDCGTGTTDSDLTYDLGSGNVSDTKWIIRFQLNVANIANSSASSCHIGFGISDTAGGYAASQAAIGFACSAGTNDDDYYGFGNASGTFVDNNKKLMTDTPSSSETYYVQVRRVSSTEAEIKLFSASDYTGLVETNAFTISSSITSLRYIKFASRSQNVNTCNGTVNNIKFWNNISQVDESHPASNAVDDDTATYWQSNAETNPNIYVDVSSNKNIGAMTVYWNSNSTETQIKLQSSTNASAWTDLRTLNVTSLTAGQYNYIRFNVAIGRYFRVYGNSGTSYVMAINEIKCEEFTDAELIVDHGHLAISSSDTSLALNGT
jgi:hypothetical protein